MSYQLQESTEVFSKLRPNSPFPLGEGLALIHKVFQR